MSDETVITDEYLDRLQAICDAATAGPWEVADCGLKGEVPEVIRREPDGDWAPIAVFEDVNGQWWCPDYEQNRPFIAASRTAMPLLIAEVRRLRGAILSFGNGNDFDWKVLGRIDELETENARLLGEVASAGKDGLAAGILIGEVAKDLRTGADLLEE